MMTFLRQDRQATNLNTYEDCSFTASASGTFLTVSAIILGSISPPTLLFGYGVTPGTQIVSQVSGSTGGAGVYTLSTGQSLSSAKFASGQILLTQTMDVVFQLDVHGPNSASNASIISTFFRDQTAITYWQSSGTGGLSPAYTDDPVQMPFVNDQSQVEIRWVVTAHMSANISINAPQDYFDAAIVTIENPVDTFRPV